MENEKCEVKKCPSCDKETFIVETSRCYICGYGIPTKEKDMLTWEQLYNMFVGKIN